MWSLIYICYKTSSRVDDTHISIIYIIYQYDVWFIKIMRHFNQYEIKNLPLKYGKTFYST